MSPRALVAYPAFIRQIFFFFKKGITLIQLIFLFEAYNLMASPQAIRRDFEISLPVGIVCVMLFLISPVKLYFDVLTHPDKYCVYEGLSSSNKLLCLSNFLIKFML